MRVLACTRDTLNETTALVRTLCTRRFMSQVRVRVKSNMNLHPAIFISAALALAACAATPPDVRVDSAGTDLSKCQSFAWLPASEDAASFTEQRVRSAVMQQLEEKGYNVSSDAPDCKITYLLATRERPRQRPSVGVGAGGGSRGVGGGIGVNIPIGQRDRHVGEFTLDVVDVASNSQIWRGSIDATFAEAEPTQDELHGAVQTVLQEFPDQNPR